jgi:hypothetical protein
MPVGATIGAAVIGGGASIYASSKATKAQQNAAGQAADTSLQVAQENNQLARDMYAKNEAHLAPTERAGHIAGDELLGLLLGPAPAGTATTTTNGYFSLAPPPAAPTTGGTTTTPTPTGSGNAVVPPDVQQLQNNGVPGDYQSALTQYYLSHNPTAAEIAAMRNDGVAGNYAAATAALAALGPNAPTLAQINAMKKDGIAHNYASALAAYNAAAARGSALG